MSLRSADSLVAPAVAETLDALELAPEDAAATRLAERYAAQLDQAAGMEAAADRVLRRASEEDVELVEEVRALRQKLAAHVILTQVGPKLHDVLTSLGATPKARASLAKGGPARGSGGLQAIRSSRSA